MGVFRDREAGIVKARCKRLAGGFGGIAEASAVYRQLGLPRDHGALDQALRIEHHVVEITLDVMAEFGDVAPSIQ